MKRGLTALLGLGLAMAPVVAGGLEIGLQNPYLTTGARTSSETLVPTVRKWYLPQNLYLLYGWRGDDYTNYARQLYSRYVDIELEGTPLYDIYGNYITRGWSIYSWNLEYPREYGSGVFKDPRFGSWFSRAVVSASSRGQFYTALTVGEGIRTTLTPMTFSKPLFDGVQWDLLTDKYALTVLGSRIDNPATVTLATDQGPSRETVFTQLLGLHGTVAVGDFVSLGYTWLSAFHQNSAIPLEDNSLDGVLGGRLNAGNVRKLVVRLADDSPDDGRGGALLLREQLFLDGVEHPEVEPLIEGGVLRQGLVEASGGNVVTLTYDIENDFRAGARDQVTDFKEIGRIEVALVVANDYRIEVASNMQTNATGEPAFLPVARAPGNITDGSNQRSLRFRYGLPTANALRGLDLAIKDIHGFDLKSEYVSNRRARRFPNQNIQRRQDRAADEAAAYYVTASQTTYPFFAYGELFSMDPDYSTAMFVPDGTGQIDYENETVYQYEFVDDNDDQDRYPDWRRRYTGLYSGSNQIPDREVFPGLDENNDVISDFNQNRNEQPDYAEPFLRYYVDPPEFLFGLDMNNNTVIDRFENDTEPDYPYKRDHRGYNAYAGVEVVPGSRVILGRLAEQLRSGFQRNHVSYALVTIHGEVPRHGVSVDLMESVKRVHDNITDNLVQWTQPPFSSGLLQEYPDPLIARNTWVNTFYLQVKRARGLALDTKLKVETYHQQGRQAAATRNQRYLGLVNKADYRIPLTGAVELWPQWKQLLALQRPTERSRATTRELSEILFLLLDCRLTPALRLGVGTEYEFYENLKATPVVLPAGFQRDFSRLTLGLQLSNTSAYQGYHLNSNIGFRLVRRSMAGQADTNTMAFVTVYAGAGTDR